MSPPAHEDALHLAAEIFRRGPVHTEPSGPGRVERDVTRFRQDPSWHTRAAVIEAVTAAAVAVPEAREETP